MGFEISALVGVNSVWHSVSSEPFLHHNSDTLVRVSIFQRTNSARGTAFPISQGLGVQLCRGDNVTWCLWSIWEVKAWNWSACLYLWFFDTVLPFARLSAPNDSAINSQLWFPSSILLVLVDGIISDSVSTFQPLGPPIGIVPCWLRSKLVIQSCHL